MIKNMAYWKSKFAKSEANSPFHHVTRSPSTPGSHNWRHKQAGGTFSDDEHGEMRVTEIREKQKKYKQEKRKKKEDFIDDWDEKYIKGGGTSQSKENK